MDQLIAALSGQWGGAAVMFAVGALALTGRIRWHTDLEEVKGDRDRWRDLALDLLQTNDKLADAATTTSEVVAATVPAIEGPS